MTDCPQTVLEPILHAAAREYPQADLRFGHEFISFGQDRTGVTSVVRDHGSDQTIIVRSRFLIGADGARSRVVEQAGLPVEGSTGLSAAVNIWFEAPLGRYLAHRPGVVHWNVMPGTDPFTGLGALICHRPWDEFVLTMSYDPADGELPLSEQFAISRIRRLVGDDSLRPVIKGFSSWTINKQVATRYRAGRVFGMGDAVHRHSPTGGLGLNTSIADAFNLCWKVAAVVHRQAGHALLDSYSSERQPVGRQVVDHATDNVQKLKDVVTALGLVPGQSKADGWTALDQLYQTGPDGHHRRAALRAAIERTNYQFNALGVELGYRYRGGARVSDGSPEPSHVLDAELYYEPTTWPGAYLPHAWLERPFGADRGPNPMSTLDLVSGGHFSLITGVGGDGWAAAAREASQATTMPIDVHHIGTPHGLVDSYGDWEKLRGTESDGAVLVRPDRHVGWRCDTAVPDASELLTEVMYQLLGRSSNAAKHRATEDPR